MSQDTRKDKRAKVVSLNVRYKSATVDEFIENHSHDVSKGGLFVKTPTPFAPGTLLKFEIRLAGDQSVISGVGRVVWKREPPQAGVDKPAGMGVKFIKIDDSSRAIIDRLTAEKANAGSAYTSEHMVEEATTVHPSTLRGLVAAERVEAGLASVNPPPQPSAGPGALARPATLAGPRQSVLPNVVPYAPPPPPASARSSGLGPPRPPPARPGAMSPPAAKPPPAPPPSDPTVARAAPPPSDPTVARAAPHPPSRTATTMGMAARPAARASAVTPPPPAAVRGRSAEPMFPTLDLPSSGGHGSGDLSVMKQAAELLEEALMEAGGSPEEIGQNALFEGTAEAAQSGDTLITTAAIASVVPAPIAAPSPSAPLGAPVPVTSDFGGSSPSQPLIIPAPAPIPQKLSTDLEASKQASGGAGLLVVLLLGLLVAVGGVVAWRTGTLAPLLAKIAKVAPTTATTSAPVPPPPASSPAIATTAAPAPATVDGPHEAKDGAAGLQAADAASARSAEVDAGKAETSTAVAAPKPPPAPKPVAPPRPPPKPPAAPKPPPVDTAAAPTGEAAPAPAPAPPAPAPAPAPAPTPTMDSFGPP